MNLRVKYAHIQADQTDQTDQTDHKATMIIAQLGFQWKMVISHGIQ